MKNTYLEKLMSQIDAFLIDAREAKPETVQDIARRIAITYRAASKELPESLRDSELWDLWFGIHQETAYSDNHPRFATRKRLFDYDHTYPLYPDGTNDTTMTTALRAAFNLAKKTLP